ncbi:glycosyltransferase [Hoyosella sp. YIM 151337]|nr:glycosyltransferase [Hoyosella sp. YIM 151337]
MARRSPLCAAVTFGATLAGAGAAFALLNAATTPRLRTVAPPRQVAASIAVCIPARNEEGTLPRLIADLRVQRGVSDMRVYVLDDASTDETAVAARTAIAGDSRFTLRSWRAEPPPGWLGKQAACHELSRTALAAGADVLVFVDADVRLGPGAIAAACSALERSDAGAVAVWPSQTAGSCAELLTQPLLAWSWMTTLPVAVSNRSLKPSLAVGCGQFLVFTARAYDEAGGHAAVANSLTEDLAITRNVRRSGNRTRLVSGAGHCECRMYTSTEAILSGYGRWLGSAFGGRAGAAALSLALLFAYVIPPLAAIFGSGRIRRAGVAGYCAAVVSRAATALTEHPGRARYSPTHRWSYVAAALLHPCAVLAFLGLLGTSVRRLSTGTAQWKGRAVR